MTEPEYVLKASHITKCFRRSLFSRKAKEVLLDVNLYLEPGHTVGLLGSSGCGKAHLLKS